MKKVNNDADAFDFDYWRDLAKNDPALFEKKRLEAIEEVLFDAPKDSQHRLRGLQWRIDMERKRAKNPTDSCLRVYNMMWKKVYAKDGLLDALDGLLTFNGKPSEAPRDEQCQKSADVLTFRVSNT